MYVCVKDRLCVYACVKERECVCVRERERERERVRETKNILRIFSRDKHYLPMIGSVCECVFVCVCVYVCMCERG